MKSEVDGKNNALLRSVAGKLSHYQYGSIAVSYKRLLMVFSTSPHVLEPLQRGRTTPAPLSLTFKRMS